MTESLLEIESLDVGYGEGVVVHDLSLNIDVGGSLALLGRNGAGKSTLMLAIAGHLAPRKGRLRFGGKEITTMPPHLRSRMGVGWVPQGREVFAPLTVQENLRIAETPGAWTIDRVYELFPKLKERRANFGNQLSGGEQQMLAIGRALVTNPRLLLLDEPLEGLAPVVAQDVARCITEITQGENMAVILIEQHAGFALRLAQHAIILERGVAVRSGPSMTVAQDRDALEQFVGIRKPVRAA
ncbi:ABC transporter ATP-binding protein [Bradyrhizobium manausense]|uniref:ABC transporter ATP-binding protein n=1 Tax=Bradyrhizobium TaxID=374 RepID=UPI001BAAE5C8|nr:MULTISPECIES: ABC transporter ATP-binding protein [Bradyrhizobium]MBR0827195.1 ABC transporter ATP-binding protein [Bradyrhizobium manausense]UVO27020.1 ABC transporter ATP-binding protein [Bradyrhizobium arachidis]